jgi:DNA polymerase-3 subunit alpha
MPKKFACGCVFETNGNKICFTPDIEKINLNCPATWDLIASGNTKGCFQMESQLVSSFAKKLKPSNIEHLAALVSIVRPGVLEAELDGKSLTSHYIDRKNGEEEVTYYHKFLESVLNKTFGILIYQEQVLEICKSLAGFSLQEADSLRKAMGKKKPEEMAKLKDKFIDGAVKSKIVNKKEAEEIFGWIEKSQRYNFNASHAVSYALMGYLTAYCKAHFPVQFFVSYLYYAEEKIDPMEEIRSLVNNAKQMGIEVYPPDFRKQNEKFKAFDDGIYFGLADIKGVGVNVVNAIKAKLEEYPNWREFGWLEFLVRFSDKIKIDAFKAMLSVGAFSWFAVPRTKMLYELDTFSKLTDRELKWVRQQNFASKDLTELWQLLNVMWESPTGKNGAVASTKRKDVIASMIALLRKPPHNLDDSPTWIAVVEEQLLGIALTCTKIDESKKAFLANCSCKEFLSGKGGNVSLAVKVDGVREITTKNGQQRGKKMAFLNVSDQTGSLDSVVLFAQQWEQFKRFCVSDNLVMISGKKDKKQGGLIVEKVYQI